MRLKRIHHIDFVVKDLDRAVEKYRSIFGAPIGERERLEYRGIETARFRLGDTWIILVQPVSEDSPVQKFLDRYGEGFFHIAYEADDLERLAGDLKTAGVKLVNEVPRRGLEGWKLVDLEMDETFGVMTQLVGAP